VPLRLRRVRRKDGRNDVAGCLHRKEGVDGSSPSEGSAKAPQGGQCPTYRTRDVLRDGIAAALKNCPHAPGLRLAFIVGACGALRSTRSVPAAPSSSAATPTASRPARRKRRRGVRARAVDRGPPRRARTRLPRCAPARPDARVGLPGPGPGPVLPRRQADGPREVRFPRVHCRSSSRARARRRPGEPPAFRPGR
jgi:hypothetical protein